MFVFFLHIYKYWIAAEAIRTVHIFIKRYQHNKYLYFVSGNIHKLESIQSYHEGV